MYPYLYWENTLDAIQSERDTGADTELTLGGDKNTPGRGVARGGHGGGAGAPPPD